MNGQNRIGMYHVWRAWGDTQLASMFGTSAVAIGSEPANRLPVNMATEPVRFPLERQLRAAAEHDQTVDNCQARCTATTKIMRFMGGGVSMEECLAACRGETKQAGCLVRLPGGYCAVPATVGYALLGIALIVAGAYAFVKA